MYDNDIVNNEEEFNIVIQINGKVRDQINVSADTDQTKIEKLALEREKVKNFTKDKKIKKIIYVKKRLINIVI